MPSIELKNHAGKLLETRECVFAVRQPLLYRSQLIILAEYPPTASVCELPYDNASSRYVSNILGETPYDWVDIVPLTTVTELTGNVCRKSLKKLINNKQYKDDVMLRLADDIQHIATLSQTRPVVYVAGRDLVTSVWNSEKEAHFNYVKTISEPLEIELWQLKVDDVDIEFVVMDDKYHPSAPALAHSNNNPEKINITEGTRSQFRLANILLHNYVDDHQDIEKLLDESDLARVTGMNDILDELHKLEIIGGKKWPMNMSHWTNSSYEISIFLNQCKDFVSTFGKDKTVLKKLMELHIFNTVVPGYNDVKKKLLELLEYLGNQGFIKFMNGGVASALVKNPDAFWIGIDKLIANDITGQDLITFMCDGVASALVKNPDAFWIGIDKLIANDITGQDLIRFMSGSVASALVNNPDAFWIGIDKLIANDITGKDLITFMCDGVASALVKNPDAFWSGFRYLRAIGLTVPNSVTFMSQEPFGPMVRDAFLYQPDCFRYNLRRISNVFHLYFYNILSIGRQDAKQKGDNILLSREFVSSLVNDTLMVDSLVGIGKLLKSLPTKPKSFRSKFVYGGIRNGNYVIFGSVATAAAAMGVRSEVVSCLCENDNSEHKYFFEYYYEEELYSAESICRIIGYSKKMFEHLGVIYNFLKDLVELKNFEAIEQWINSIPTKLRDIKSREYEITRIINLNKESSCTSIQSGPCLHLSEQCDDRKSTVRTTQSTTIDDETDVSSTKKRSSSKILVHVDSPVTKKQQTDTKKAVHPFFGTSSSSNANNSGQGNTKKRNVKRNVSHASSLNTKTSQPQAIFSIFNTRPSSKTNEKRKREYDEDVELATKNSLNGYK